MFLLFFIIFALYINIIMDIISLHFPKTAGTSFRKVLEDNYGEKLLKDYDNININNYNLNDYDIVHGHLLIDKYYSINSNCKVITWLRNPLDRIISYYNFWNKYDTNEKEFGKWHIKFNNEKPSFSEFIKNWYTIKDEFKIYTNNFNINDFYFVGIVERYNRDIEILGDILKWNSINNYKENKTENNLKLNKKDIKLFNEIFKYEIEIYNFFKNNEFF